MVWVVLTQNFDNIALTYVYVELAFDTSTAERRNWHNLAEKYSVTRVLVIQFCFFFFG